jgi:hypothetical protein
MTWTGQRRIVQLYLVVVMTTLALGGSASILAAAPPTNPAGRDGQPLPEVVVIAKKDKRRLDRVIIPRFVESHGTPNSYTQLVGRWTSPGAICVSTTGLEPAAADYVSRRIITDAASVGAPTAKYGDRKPTVIIAFTPDPQAQVSYFGKTDPEMQGYDGVPLNEGATFSHPIRAWYRTITYAFGNGWTFDSKKPLVPGDSTRQDAPSYDQEPGSASRLSTGKLSGIANVLVIADTKQVSAHSLRVIADYIAMLVLTRTSVDGCSELPSIIDLLSADCAGRAPPDSLTPADVAYLKALYSADLEKNLNIEQGNIHKRMSHELLDK